MQDFASKCCQFNAARSPSNATIMNADGIYLATYSSLLLNLKLIFSGYYKGESVCCFLNIFYSIVSDVTLNFVCILDDNTPVRRRVR